MWESLLVFLRHIYRHTHIYIHGFALKWSIQYTHAYTKFAIERGELDEKLLNLGVPYRPYEQTRRTMDIHCFGRLKNLATLAALSKGVHANTRDT